MPTYFFEQITEAQAASYAATDALAFLTPELAAADIQVRFIAGTATVAEAVVITALGRSVTFGVSIEGEIDILLPDGSVFYVGTALANVDPRPGGAGNDAFYGNDGADRFAAGAGNNYLHGNRGADTLTSLGGTDTLLGGQGNDSIGTGDGANYAHGNMGDDSVTGGLGADFLYGGQGNDQVTGGGGADRLYGDLGSDTITGGVDNDTILGGDGADRISTGAGMNAVAAEAGDDSITGGAGADTLHGGEGADTIAGGAYTAGVANGARDILYGGGGVDRFMFAATDSSTIAGNIDQILDWESTDRIAITGNGAATAISYSELTAANFADAVVAANAAIAAGVINYVAVQVENDVILFADAPIAGNGVAELAIVLVGRSLPQIDFTNIVV